MLYENEIVMLILGIGIFFFITIYKEKIKRIYNWKTLLTSFYLVIAALTF